jgi:hypothetical protein
MDLCKGSRIPIMKIETAWGAAVVAAEIKPIEPVWVMPA